MRGWPFACGARNLRGEALLGKPAIVKPRQCINHRQFTQDQRVMLLFRKLPPQPLDEHLLVDRVDIEKNDESHQPKYRLPSPSS